jgi:hypothetical protein
MATRVIQVAFANRQGSVAGHRNVALAAPGGGAVRVRQANDGRIFLAWVDAGEDGQTLHATRFVCE